MPFVLPSPVLGSKSGVTCPKCLTSALPGRPVPSPGTSFDDPFENSLCRKFALQEGARRLAGSKALDGCFRRRQFGQDVLEAVYYPARDTSGLRHVQRCGSRWACPVCAALLSELSRRELRAGIDAHEARYGVGSVLMATFTVPHYDDQSCAAVLGSQNKWLTFPVGTPVSERVSNPLYGGLKRALHEFVAGRAGQALYASAGILGTVRNLEVTHGANGWHCHSHALWFLDRVLSASDFKRCWLLARNRWLDAVQKAGLPVASLAALKKHGFRLTSDRAYIEDYVTKLGKETDWHLEHELAKQAVKLGKFGGRSPMQLLADYTFDGDEAAGVLWAEYAATYRGSRQLYWSKGLRLRLLGSEREYTDEELMGIKETGQLPEWARPPEHVLILSPTDREWAKICADGTRGLFLGHVRHAGKTGDHSSLERFFAPYRAYDRALWSEAHPVTPARFTCIARTDRDDAPPLEEGEEETTLPPSLYTHGGAAYQNPLIRDPAALDYWPGLTSSQADRYQLLHSRYQAEEGEGLPFFEQRRTEKQGRQIVFNAAETVLSAVWASAGGLGVRTAPAYDLAVWGASVVSAPAAWSRPGDTAVLRVLTYALRLCPGLAVSEEKPPLQVALSV